MTLCQTVIDMVLNILEFRYNNEYMEYEYNLISSNY